MHRDQRLFAGFALLIVALLAVAGVLLRGMMSRSLSSEAKVQTAFLDLALRDRSRYLAATLQPARERGQWPENLSDVLTRNHADYNRDIFMQVFDQEARLVAESANTPAPLGLAARTVKDGPRALRWISDEAADADGRPLRLVTYPIYAGDPNDPRVRALGYAQAGMHLPDASRAIARVTWMMIAALGTFGLLCILAVRYFIYLAARRAQEDAQALQAAQHRFIADAAHELGTPLAIIRGEIDIALRRERTAEEYHAALASCREEIERLSRLSENLLSLATADSGAQLLHREPCDAAAIARNVHGKFARLAAEKQIGFTVRAPESLHWHADTIAIEQVLGNLISNALRHTPAGDTVALELTHDECSLIFQLTDTGEGIPPAHLPRLFERFHRVDKARSRSAGGAGLGLAIVRTLVEAHHGTVSVQSTLGQGTTFRSRFPLHDHSPE